MKNTLLNGFSILLNIILNKSNLNKFLIIFFAGFLFRVIMDYFYDVNAFLCFFNAVSISYYICMSTFIILVHEFVDSFDFNIIPSFRFLIVKECIKVFYFNGLDNKMFMDSNEMKPKGKIGFSDKANSRFSPVKSPLSNPPITPANINEMKPFREVYFSNKPSSSLRPRNWVLDGPTTNQQVLAYQERNKYIT